MNNYENLKCEHCNAIGELVKIKQHIEYQFSPQLYKGDELICCSCGLINKDN